jgi:hypothetical protein
MRAYRAPMILSGLNLVLLVWLVLTTSSSANGQSEAGGTVPALRANSIELVDNAGKVRAQLMVTEDSGALLRMRDANGEVRVKLEAAVDGSGMLLANRDAQPGLHILAKRGATTLSLADSGGEPHVIRATAP